MSVAAQSYQLSDYLEKLQGTTFKKLYQQPSTAFAIFRCMLPPLAKKFVHALLYLPDPMPIAFLDTWVKHDHIRLKDRAVVSLKSLYMVQITRDKPQEMSLSTNFKNSMRMVLEGSGNHQSFGIPSTLPVDPNIDVAFLDRHARRKWEDILHFVVNSVGSVMTDYGAGDRSGSGPHANVKDLLLAGRLVERRMDTKSGMGITQAGFTFLLQEANAQVWTLLLLWLERADHKNAQAGKDGKSSKDGGDGMDSVDMLSFIFMLAFLELGHAYDTSALTPIRRNMLMDLEDFGLVYIPRGNDKQYFPTRLATSLTSTSSAQRSVSASFTAVMNNTPGDAGSLGLPGTDTSHKGAIIIETNHRLYAYTSSPLQIAVLNLFVTLDMRFSNMVSGRISRESIRKAIRQGITADQIISYLQAHAHEQMSRHAASTGKTILPPTVVDQIRLWQLENERMKTVPGFLFVDFADKQEYVDLATYCEEIGILIWKNDDKKMFFASKTEPIREWLKSRKK